MFHMNIFFLFFISVLNYSFIYKISWFFAQGSLLWRTMFGSELVLTNEREYLRRVRAASAWLLAGDGNWFSGYSSLGETLRQVPNCIGWSCATM